MKTKQLGVDEGHLVIVLPGGEKWHRTRLVLGVGGPNPSLAAES